MHFLIVLLGMCTCNNVALSLKIYSYSYACVYYRYKAVIEFSPQGNYSAGLPLIVMGLVPLITGLLSILLPETKGKPLPDTLQELRNMS